MARDFTKNTANRMTLGNGALGSIINGAAKISVHARIYRHSGTNAANADRLLNIIVGGSTSGVILGIDATGPTPFVYVGARSRTADGFQKRTGTTYNASISRWHSVGGTIDFAGDTITPYGGGAADNGGAVTFGNASFTYTATPTVPDAIGGDGVYSVSSNQIDGLLTDVAVWAGELSADDFAALAAGYSASMIRPDILVSHFLLDQAAADNENDHWGGLTGTISGTIGGGEDPPLIYPAGVLSVVQAAGSPPAPSSGAGNLLLLGCGA